MRRKLLSVSLIVLCAVVFLLVGSPTVVGRGKHGEVKIRYLGHSAFEIATPDYETVVYIDPWITHPLEAPNMAWDAWGVTVPTEYKSLENLVDYIKKKGADLVVILVTHDHFDHGLPTILELVPMLYEEKDITVKVVAIFELASYIASELGAPGPEIVINYGYGMNIGGTVTIDEESEVAPGGTHGTTDGVVVTQTFAAHSGNEVGTGVPGTGFVVTINGVTIYHAGDTALFSDMKLIRRLYQPHVALLPVGDVFTMGPREAAIAAGWIRPKVAIPMHYCSFPLIKGVEAGEEFQNHVSRRIKVKILEPGELFEFSLPRFPRWK